MLIRKIMARIIPPDYNAPTTTSLHESERQTLEYLAEALHDNYTVFSSVLWSRSTKHSTGFGEIDFCIVSPAGQLIVIEQKSGSLTVRNGHVYKRYGVTDKDAGKQLHRNVSALKAAWQKQNGATVDIDYLLYLPDYTVREQIGAQLDISRIVHAGSKESLAQTIENICGDLMGNAVKVSQMHNFLTGVLELELDIGRLQTHQEHLYRRHEDSLLSWVQRLSFKPYILRINGCAGSGKTQIGLGLFQEARSKSEVVHYICFNRPLADSLAQAVNDPERIQTKDTFYAQFLQSQQIAFDDIHRGSQYYERLEKTVANTAIPNNRLLDLLIIDEGQDFSQQSLDVLRRFLRPSGRLVWLEDPEQNLYQQDSVTLEHAVELQLDQCFRSPTAIVEYLTTLFAIKRPLIPANPHYGLEPEFIPVTRESLADQLEAHIQRLLSRGAALKDIAIVSLHGLASSTLNTVNQIGEYQLSRATGQYTDAGQPIWTDGEIIYDSIYRFKGSQRPFILLIDADFKVITDKEVRLFYCGMTRATLAVDIFLTARCETALSECLFDRSKGSE